MELPIVRDKAAEIVATLVENFYHEISLQFGRALLFTFKLLWKSRPTMTYGRLNSKGLKK